MKAAALLVWVEDFELDGNPNQYASSQPLLSKGFLSIIPSLNRLKSLGGAIFVETR